MVIAPWPLTSFFGLAAALMVVRGLFIGFGIGIWETVVMELVPESMLSRVVGLDFFGSVGLTPVGYALAAGLSDLYSPSQILVTGFGLSAVLWLAPLKIERVHNAA